MEIYRRKVGYEDFGRTENLVVTATTLYFPFLLTQNFEDIGVYTDVENPVYEIVDFSGHWNLSANTGTYQKPCLILNNCVINFTSTPITYFNANNGTLMANISGCAFTPSPSTIQWTGPGGFTSNNLTAGMNNLAAGSYTIKITDANCDISYATYYLHQPQNLSITLNSNNSQTNVTTPGGCNGSANTVIQGGQPPYTYLWYSGNTSNVLPGTNSSTTSVTNLCAGTYNVQVTDFGGTIVSGLFTITEPQPISGSVISTTNVSCAGGSTGSINVAAFGGVHPTGYTYILTGPTGSTVTSTGGATFNNLLACPSSTPCYNVQILDGVGNVVNLPVSITQPLAVNLGVTYKDSGCYGSSTGMLTLSPTGGVSPYYLNILPSGLYPGLNQTLTGPITLNNLPVGSYTMSIKDSINCVGPTQTVTIKERPQLNVSVATPSTLNGYNILCNGATTAITVTTSYTSYPTTYTVPSNTMYIYLDGVLKKTQSPGPGTVTITGVTAGNHTITVVDTATAGSPVPFYLNCSATTTVTLTQPPTPLSFVGTPNIDIINIFSGCTPACTGTNAGPCVQAIVGVNGGVTPYTINWVMLTTPSAVTGPAWGTGITSNPFCTTMGAYTTLKVTVQDANGCKITSTINV